MANSDSPKGDKPKEAILPHYPALIRCLLIDSRHGSRTELVKDLKASALFEEIVEAKSIDNAETMLTLGEYDAVFVGPSVSEDRLVEFLQQAKALSMAKDCAFIVVTDIADLAAEPLLAAGAHNLLRRPHTRQRFFEAVVQGVVKANEGGPWAAIVKANGGVVIPGTVPSLGALEKTTSTGSHKALKAAQDGDNEAMYLAVLNATAEELSILSAGLREGRIKVSADHKLDEAGHSEVRAIIGRALASANLQNPLTQEFMDYFEDLLLEWVVNVKLSNEKEATEQLRMQLLGFYPGKPRKKR